MRLALLLLVISCTLHIARAQSTKEVKGVVVNSTGEPIVGATIRLTSSLDTLKVSTGDLGKFNLKSVKSSVFRIEFHSLGYSTLIKSYDMKADLAVFDLKSIILTEKSIELEEVGIEATPDVYAKGDTIEFRTRHIELGEYALTEELMKKLPGMHVDISGRLFFNGKPIEKVRINGVDFFGGAVVLALKNLPADLINKAQLINDYGDEAALTGIKEGDPKTVLNLIVDEDRNRGFFSNNSLGKGSSKVYDVQLGANVFNGPKQLGGYIGSNNAGIPFMMQSGFVMVMGRESNNGIKTASEAGFNFASPLSKKLSTQVSYKFEKNKSDLQSSVFGTQSFADDKSTINDSQESKINDGSGHSFNALLVFNPDKVTRIQLDPRANFSNVRSRERSQEVYSLFEDGTKKSHQTKQTIGESRSKTNEISGNFFVNRRLNSKGRNMNFSSNFGFNETISSEDKQDLLSFFDVNTQVTKDSVQVQQIHVKSNMDRINFRLSYSEPLSKRSKLDFEIAQNFNFNENNRSVFDVADGFQYVDSLSNFNENNVSMSTGQVSYRYQTPGNTYTIGLRGINTLMKGRFEEFGDLSSRNTLDVVPVVSAQIGDPNSTMLHLNYSAMPSYPSLAQLNPIVDRTNPQFIIVGNPDLNSQFMHVGMVGIQKNNLSKGKFTSASFGVRYYQNKIVNKVSLLNDANGFLFRETRYENLSGDYLLNSQFMTSFPFANGKTVLTYESTVDFSKQYFFENELKEFSNMFKIKQSLDMRFNPNDGIYITPGLSYSLQNNSYSVKTTRNEPISTLELKTEGLVNLFTSYSSVFAFSKNFNKGYGNGLAYNSTIINLSVQKHFFKDKAGILKLTANDLLDQNVSIFRSSNSTSTIDRRENTIGRYILLSYSHRFGRF